MCDVYEWAFIYLYTTLTQNVGTGVDQNVVVAVMITNIP